MNDKIWQWIGDYCSGLLDESEEWKLRAWIDEAEENKRLFMEGVKMVYPNAAMDKEFAEAFYEAQAAGVKVLNLACRVEKDELEVL